MLNRWAGSSGLPLNAIAALFFADTGVTSAADAVSSWADQSGLGHNLVQATGANQPIYLPYSGSKYAYHARVAGNYYGTPDAAENRITGDIDIRADIAMDSWAPTSARLVVGKTASGVFIYALGVATTGILFFMCSKSGTYEPQNDRASTAQTGFAAGSRNWIRVTYSCSSHTATFYTSTDGITWVQLGESVTTYTATSIASSAANVAVGQSYWTGFEIPMSGKTYRAQIYNGINGTLAVDFNPASWTSGSTWTSATGETWTINNAAGTNKPAQIVDKASLLFDGAASYLKTAAFTLNQPCTIYLVKAAITWTLNDEILDGVGGRAAVIQSPTTGKEQLYAGVSGPSLANDTGSSYSVSAIVFNGASSSISRNGGTAIAGDAGTGNPGGITLGSLAAGTSNGNFQIVALAVYSAAHDAATQTRVVNFLRSKYGI